MREVLFRGITKNTGNWIYGDLRKRYDDVSYRIASKSPADMLPSGGYEFVEVEEDTIGQYIGLTDVEDRKIFEGDIVYFGSEHFCEYDGPVLGIVKYDGDENSKGYPGFDIFHVVDSPEYNLFSAHSFGEAEVKVVTNIHESPKLAKKIEMMDSEVVGNVEFEMADGRPFGVTCPDCGNDEAFLESMTIHDSSEFLVVKGQHCPITELESAVVVCKHCNCVFGLTV